MLPIYRPYCIWIEGLTHFVKRVVFELGLNVLGRNRVRHKSDTRIRFVSPRYSRQATINDK
jgi:hypothetical protein